MSKLSSYAFNTYGSDAKLYNGVHDLEAENKRLRDALQLWSEIGFDFWICEDAWDMKKPAEGDERAWVNLSAITREALAPTPAES